MNYKVDALKLFYPYIQSKYNIPCFKNATNIYFNVRTKDSFGIRIMYSNTDYFKDIESRLMDEYEVIDDTFESIIIMMNKDLVLEESFKQFIEGNYSKLHRKIYVDYISTFKTVAEMKDDLIFQIVTKNASLRKKIEEDLNISLRKDAELGNLPDPDFYNYNFEYES